ncbi:lon protease homolog 2, peroxisomal-like [Uloborus diversus]|uniref:lon protease homolog 2, peroxisomal-like n=1 Tax=Uloborus diversus TaxID=327109 RepID=UPI00240A092D|nr:lon protease homolog 2, peroxisomal-like [Uloborus diversus]
MFDLIASIEGVVLASKMATSNIKLPRRLPLLLIDGVLFPGASIRIPVSSEKNMNMVRNHLLSRSTLSSAIIGVVPRELHSSDEDDGNVLHSVGTAGIVIQVTGTNWPRPAYTLLVTGLCRFKLERITEKSPYLIASVRQLDRLPGEESEIDESNSELSDLMEQFREQATKLIDMLDLSVPAVVRLKRLLNSLPTESLPDVCAAIVRASHSERLQILDAVDLAERFRKTLPLLVRQIEGLQLLQKARKEEVGPLDLTKIPITRTKLYDDMDKGDEIAALEKKVRETEMPEHAKKLSLREIQRLKKMPPHMPDHAVTRNYIELMTELPWTKQSPEVIDINKSRADLDADHYGMEKLKKRVLEYLAVRQLKNSLKGPILCFVGPPGVGKTSVGRSVASSLGREFHRISLGGVCDQSDIRGHRRTYIGSMPGRIIQGLRTVGVKNPVFLLDEIDKMSTGIHGDPAAAMLEVLDPEQNCNFTDHYLNVPFDLSQVLFIATANSVTTIPPALLDRMEIISVPGYTHDEKEHIARHHLVPKQLKEHGLTPDMIQITDDAIRTIIAKYTREAGVRGLERKLGAVCRAVAVKVVEKQRLLSSKECHVGDNEEKEDKIPFNYKDLVLSPIAHPPELPFVLDSEAVTDILGTPIYDSQVIGRIGQPGVAVGLAWTPAGGEIMYVEASKMDGDGQLILTGQLGKVMKESAQLALNLVRSHTHEYGIKVQSGVDLMEGTDIHIHFPAGAVGKDGPSAGVTIVTVLVSLFTGRVVKSDVAMTGEITLRGLVLPVGGIKEKVLAAHRAGMRSCILPSRNEKDLVEIPQSVQNDMNFHLCSHVDDVLQAAFEGGFAISSKNMEIKSKL